MDDTEFGRDVYDPSSAEGLSQLIAVAVLEFGVILHSLIIGLTLAVNQEFITLFVVIIFHRESFFGVCRRRCGGLWWGY
jgi:hypothetical protein